MAARKTPTNRSAPTKKPPQRAMSQAHKAALGAGREESRVVRRYLDALESHRPKRGRKRTADSIGERLSAIDTQLETARGLTRVHLLQERDDLKIELSRLSGGEDLSALESEFVEVAGSYSARKGIAYRTWREAGVKADVLKKAGLNP